MTLQRVVAACGIGKVANKPSLFPAVSSRGPKATAPPLHIAWTLQLNVVGQVHGHWPERGTHLFVFIQHCWKT